jgi:phage baseplate assembly protein gpV
VSMSSRHGTAIHATEDLLLKADADVRVEAQVQLDVNAVSIVVEADGAIIIRGGRITIEGPTTIEGPLTVTGTVTHQ